VEDSAVSSNALFTGEPIQNGVFDTLKLYPENKFNIKTLIVPVVLINYGLLGFSEGFFKSLNLDTREEIKEDIAWKVKVDNYMQYVPMATVYGLNAFGLKGKHNFKERTIILGTAYIIMGTIVNTMKVSINSPRPDNSDNNSFPSGHTATSFMGAEFLRLEYADVSPWIGVAGYALATTTGVLRVYNNKHWITDVTAGAGVGILSTHIAYWLYPWINKTIFTHHSRDNHSTNYTGLILPYYNGHETGLSISLRF